MKKEKKKFKFDIDKVPIPKFIKDKFKTKTVETTILEMEMTKENIIIKLKESTKVDKVIGGFDGYILKRRLNKDWKLIKVKNFKDIHKNIGDKNAHILQDFEGRLNGKPFFMIDEKIPISLNIAPKSNIVLETKTKVNDEDIVNKQTMENGLDLCYDAKSFYTYLDFVTFRNLSTTNPNKKDLTGILTFLDDNLFVIIAVGMILGYLVFTGTGADIISGFIGGN